MKLALWLEKAKKKKYTIGMLAKKLGKHKSLVHKYAYGDVIPKFKVMQKLFKVTLGAVTANDFYDLSDQLFKEDQKKM